MKIIRPEYTPPKKEEKPVIIEQKEEIPIEATIDIIYPEPAKEKMVSEYAKKFFNSNISEPIQTDLDIDIPQGDNLISASGKIQIVVSFTQRQYDLWLRKGGERWLKRSLVGLKTVGKKGRKKRES